MRVIVCADDGDQIAIDADDVATEQAVIRLELQNPTYNETSEFECVTLTINRAREVAAALLTMSGSNVGAAGWLLIVNVTGSFIIGFFATLTGPDGRVLVRYAAAGNADEAFNLIDAQEFDIVVTDQMMPGTTGIELARTVTTYMPDAKVLLCSGRDDNIDYDEVALARIDGVMLKPFNLIELADTVECLLSEVASDASLGVWS